MRSHEVALVTMREIQDLFYRRQFAECLAKIELERRYMSGGCGWDSERPMSRDFVETNLNRYQTESENLLAFA